MDSEAEANVLILCVVSFERKWLAQASQVLESSASRGSAIVDVL